MNKDARHEFFQSLDLSEMCVNAGICKSDELLPIAGVADHLAALGAGNDCLNPASRSVPPDRRQDAAAWQIHRWNSCISCRVYLRRLARVEAPFRGAVTMKGIHGISIQTPGKSSSTTFAKQPTCRSNAYLLAGNWWVICGLMAEAVIPESYSVGMTGAWRPQVLPPTIPRCPRRCVSLRKARCQRQLMGAGSRNRIDDLAV